MVSNASLTGVFNTPEQPQVKYFDTDFGVRFGIFICFDITFPEPVNSLLKLGIRDFTFPTSWTQLPPLVTATQFQQAFSRVHESTLLAANDAYSSATSGSGLYFNGTFVETFFNPQLSGDQDEKLLMGALPKRTSKPSQTQAPTVSKQTTSLSPALSAVDKAGSDGRLCGLIPGACQFFRPRPGDAGKLTATDGNITCTLQYQVSHNSTTARETFALFAISHWDTQTCGVVKCIDDVICLILDPFLKEYTSGVVFDSLAIQASHFSPDIEVYPLLATNQGQIVQPQNVQVSGPHMSFHGTVDQPLLSANLLGLLRNKEN